MTQGRFRAVQTFEEKRMAIKRVWIEEGCIMCNACDAECPDVFLVTDNTCVIRSEVREDGQETENRDEKTPLKVELQTSLEAGIEAAAAGCPVEVIQFEKA
jgi:ferredoxin